MRTAVAARLLRIALVLTAGLLIAALIAVWQIRADRQAGQEELAQSGFVPGVQVGGPFSLIDQDGQPVTDETYRGKLLLIYFGYTYCPDICPTDLQSVAQTMDELGAASDQVQPIFITIDPARDTPQALARYVRLFHPRLVGLSGAEEQVAAAAKAYRVYARKAEQGDPDAYLMDHSTYSYLMGRDGRLLTVFAHGTTPEAMARAVRMHLKD
jgi:cytochrome oxidase Cu insertion factor (SCO1/SenC/PrrC family)